jgi:cyclophilin family peptidyl-prolyl cis-trans isomerase/HEAT repeat protein
MENCTSISRFPRHFLKKNALFFIVFCCFFYACLPPSPEPKDSVLLNFSDNPQAQWALHHWTKGQVDSLALGLESKWATQRYWSAKGLASCILPQKEPRLSALLRDSIREVSQMAAFAIGQQFNQDYTVDLTAAFIRKDSLSVNNLLNANILEAIGKCAPQEYLAYLAGVVSYRPSDDYLVRGQTLGIYRFGQRGIVSTEAVNRMANIAMDARYAAENRMIAANYLLRMQQVDLAPYQDLLIQAIKGTKNPDLIALLTTCLSRIPNQNTLAYLTESFGKTQEVSSLVAGLQVSQQYPYAEMGSLVSPLLRHEAYWVRHQAAEAIVQTAQAADFSKMKRESFQVEDEVVNAKLLGGMSKTFPVYYYESRRQVRDSLLALYGQSKNVAQTLVILESMAYDWENIDFLLNLFQTTKTIPVKTKTFEALAHFLFEFAEKDWPPSFRYSQLPSKLFEALMAYFFEGDVAAVSILSEKMEKHPKLFQEKGVELARLTEVYHKLVLPRDLEAARSLAQAMAEWSNTAYEEVMAIEYTEPDYKILEEWKEGSLLLVKTTKGNMTMQLFPDIAPATVSAFLKLVKSNYYTRKKFHRIVPNFVVQTGCPRSDGFGALDFSLRSEFDFYHFSGRGWVGMASAGRHSESQQFFITLTTTPHLDGKYTLFGKIVEGLDILYKLIPEDYIIAIEIVNRK